MATATFFDEERWKGKSQPLVYRHLAALSFLGAEDARVLDVGCGDGLFLKLVADRFPGAHLTGIDFSKNAIEQAKKHVPRGTFRILNAVDEVLPFADGSFDVVVALDILEHLFMPETLLKELKRVAHRGVILGVPNFSSLPARVQALRGQVPENNRPKKGHVYWFNYRVLTQVCASAGLRIIRLRANCPWEHRAILGRIMRACASRFPNAFALSFVVYAEKA